MQLNKCLISVVTLAVLITGCSRKEEILQGERFDLRADNSETAGVTDETALNAVNGQPISLSAARSNANWTHRNGTTAHAITHPALSTAPTLRWSRDIGTGTNARLRLSADPVIADGRVFAMDADGRLSAFSTSGGALWSVDISASTDTKDSISGGGLAYGDGILVATTGYGEVYAMDPATGTKRWSHRVHASVSSAPLVTNGKAILIAGNNKAVALELSNGRIAWEKDTAQSGAGVIGTGSPAAAGKITYLPFATGEISANLMDSGLQLWTQVVSGYRLGSARGFVDAFSGEPVVSGDVVYAGKQSGRLTALNRRTGERLWTIDEGALGPVWPAGNSVFVVTDQNNLKRLNAADGSVIWSQELPKYKNIKRKRGAYAHYGPVVAGGRVIVAGSDGQLRSFDPTNGNLVSSANIPNGAASQPAIAAGVLYILSNKGQLHAFQ
ncbi:pyrrolo-quinoline quinone [Amylibacter ulvae]|uniref:Pyrrolo-quinoline quinone n=1 Tax=Paramylibacter ulvae TaxID=1651968 RepID=A0ABQ3D2U3_9RHOB|nr:PQQ-binding-like beta-propeller repeat protein [Amylibacter ulvae]GHA53790.1 pyrrolo-quinoline quinone [Amylibacter ulvae]